MRKPAFIVVLAVALCLASAAVGQTVIETKVKSGNVIGKTDHSVVIKMDDGVVREFEVPPGRTATVDGKEVALADLKIGTTLSATFKTVAKPVEVKTVTIKDGEVVRVNGANLTTREKDGFHNYVVPKGFRFLVNGKETGVDGLGPGMKLNATIVTTSTAMTTETRREGGVTGKAPAEPTVVAAAAPPPTAPAAPTAAPAMAAAAPEKPAAPAPAPATAAPAPETAPATMAASAPKAVPPAPSPEPPAGSHTTTIVIGLIVLLLLIVLVILGTKKEK